MTIPLSDEELAEAVMSTPNTVFVFGSNSQGRHGKGAAKVAHSLYGAVYGQGEGHHGRSYAIPTKLTPWQSHTLDVIKVYVQRFLRYATTHPELTFFVTKIGCGHAGYKESQIEPMFKNAPSNVLLPRGWKR